MAVKTVPTRLSTSGIGGLGDRLLPFNVTRPPPPGPPRPVLAVDADESVLLASKVKSKDDDVRTRILLLSQRAEELQDAVNLACRHTQCSMRNTNRPRSKRQWQEMLLDLEPGQVLWTEILAGQHHRQENFTRLHLAAMKGLVQRYEGPGKVVIIDYTSIRPSCLTT